MNTIPPAADKRANTTPASYQRPASLAVDNGDNSKEGRQMAKKDKSKTRGSQPRKAGTENSAGKCCLIM